jgi:hypothetical protein
MSILNLLHHEHNTLFDIKAQYLLWKGGSSDPNSHSSRLLLPAPMQLPDIFSSENPIIPFALFACKPLSHRLLDIHLLGHPHPHANKKWHARTPSPRVRSFSSPLRLCSRFTTDDVHSLATFNLELLPGWVLDLVRWCTLFCIELVERSRLSYTRKHVKLRNYLTHFFQCRGPVLSIFSDCTSGFRSVEDRSGVGRWLMR